MMPRWRVMISQDVDDFIRDSVQVYMACADESGFRLVKPITLELEDPRSIEEVNTTLNVKPTKLPKELAEELFNHLAFYLIGTNDLPTEIKRLRLELAQANQRINKLIDGIGSLGSGKCQGPYKLQEENDE